MTRLFRQSFCHPTCASKKVCEHRVREVVADSGSCVPQERARKIWPNPIQPESDAETCRKFEDRSPANAAPRRANGIACHHTAGRIIERVVRSASHHALCFRLACQFVFGLNSTAPTRSCSMFFQPTWSSIPYLSCAVA